MAANGTSAIFREAKRVVRDNKISGVELCNSNKMPLAILTVNKTVKMKHVTCLNEYVELTAFNELFCVEANLPSVFH